MNETKPKKFVENGHFYSPVSDIDEIRSYLKSELYQRQTARVDAMLDYDAMERLWHVIREHAVEFPFYQQTEFRYYARNSQFSFFDAAILSAIVSSISPRRIVEIGCGFSSAAMFDTFDRLEKSKPISFTCIDPDMSRFDALTPPRNVVRLAERVQDVDPTIFSDLEAGDILFIDSSHVLKTGSDVHYEYLHILPSLRKGVVVHIHDIHYPFEYPKRWLLAERRNWNEVYFVDLMLTLGNSFDVLFFNHAMLVNRPKILNEGPALIDLFEGFNAKPFHKVSGSIWLQKI